MTANGGTYGAIVIGAGVAGLTAAAELAERGITTALIDDGLLGGLITNVGKLEGLEGEAESGPDLVNTLLERALVAGADYRMGAVSVLQHDDALWQLPEQEATAPAIILATGAALKQLGVPGETELTGRGVSQCAFCDGGLYRSKDVLVVGGGDAAFQEALHLAELCASVTVAIRGAAPRARMDFVQRLQTHSNVHVRTSIDVRAIIGTDGVDAIRLHDQASGSEKDHPIAAVFPFIGLAPQTALAPSEATRNADNALTVGSTMQTTLPGLYAIGATRANHGGTVADAVADAVAAAQAIAG
jgi:thioredoxin reductase (NADPH)